MTDIIGDEHRRALGLGLSGAHRTGKTAVAEILAERNDCPFIRSSAQQVAKDLGVKVDFGMPFHERMAYQEEVLRRFKEAYEQEAGNGLFVADRTPLDFAAYVLTDYHPDRVRGLEYDANGWVLDYVRRCMELTGEYFFLVAVVQPGIPYVPEEGKPAPNPLYQEIMNTCLTGLGADHRVKSHFFLMPRNLTDLQERVSVATYVYTDKINAYTQLLASHIPIPFKGEQMILN